MGIAEEHIIRTANWLVSFLPKEGEHAVSDTDRQEIAVSLAKEFSSKKTEKILNQTAEYLFLPFLPNFFDFTSVTDRLPQETLFEANQSLREKIPGILRVSLLENGQLQCFSEENYTKKYLETIILADDIPSPANTENLDWDKAHTIVAKGDCMLVAEALPGQTLYSAGGYAIGLQQAPNIGGWISASRSECKQPKSFFKLSPSDLLSLAPENEKEFPFRYSHYSTEFPASGKFTHPSFPTNFTHEQIGEGFYQSKSEPFQMLELTEACTIGAGVNTYFANAGDYILKSGNKYTLLTRKDIERLNTISLYKADEAEEITAPFKPIRGAKDTIEKPNTLEINKKIEGQIEAGEITLPIESKVTTGQMIRKKIFDTVKDVVRAETNIIKEMVRSEIYDTTKGASPRAKIAPKPAISERLEKLLTDLKPKLVVLELTMGEATEKAYIAELQAIASNFVAIHYPAHKQSVRSGGS
jgi:hypothetical protein